MILLRKITYALITSLIIWMVIAIIANPPPKTTIKHVGIMENTQPFTLSGQIIDIINHERVIWQNDKLTLDLYLIGVYVPKDFRNEAKDFLRAKLLNKTVHLEFDKQFRDRFGNYYGYLYIDNEMVNGLLIKKGLAKSAVVPPNNRYTARFLQWEVDSRKKGIGIWRKNKDIKNHFKETPEFYKSRAQINSFVSYNKEKI